MPQGYRSDCAAPKVVGVDSLHRGRCRQIALDLTISEFTVKRHIQNILGKLGLRSRREAGEFYRTANADFAGVGWLR